MFDLALTDESVEHSPVMDGEACVPLASTDAPLIMRGSFLAHAAGRPIRLPHRRNAALPG